MSIWILLCDTSRLNYFEDELCLAYHGHLRWGVSVCWLSNCYRRVSIVMDVAGLVLELYSDILMKQVCVRWGV
jgi:hypothetical protein